MEYPCLARSCTHRVLLCVFLLFQRLCENHWIDRLYKAALSAAGRCTLADGIIPSCFFAAAVKEGINYLGITIAELKTECHSHQKLTRTQLVGDSGDGKRTLIKVHKSTFIQDVF